MKQIHAAHTVWTTLSMVNDMEVPVFLFRYLGIILRAQRPVNFSDMSIERSMSSISAGRVYLSITSNKFMSRHGD